MNLTKVALSRPVFIFVLVIAAILLGTMSYLGMRKELDPEVNFGTITIQTLYSGAGPEDINELISRKIEEAVSGVNGVREITSTSQEGLSSVVVALELGTNTDAALNDARSKVDAISNTLPKDALKPQVSKIDASSTPILSLAISSTTLDSKDLRDLIDDKIRDRFAQIGGVAAATVQGGDLREVQVQLEPSKLNAYGIGIADIQKAVASASLNSPAGRLVDGPLEYSVRVKGDFSDPKQIRDMIITVSDPKSFGSKAKTLRLSDVATVTDTIAERTAYSRLNGNDTISISIQKQREGNAVEITKAADAVIESVTKEYKSIGLGVTKTFEQSKQITDSLADLQFALFFGIFLVAIIVYIFLHNLRGTIIVAVAIPVSLFGTFIALNLAGFTINNMSMLALSLAIGVLVDDAIVVLENIYRHLKMGEDPRDAALNGRAEIGLAALAITFADVVVFLPVAFMGGIAGQFFKPLALGFVFATIISLFVSFTLTPLLAARWYKKGEDVEHATGWFAIGFERNFARLESAYRRALEWSLNHRWFVFCLGSSAIFSVITFLQGGFVPSQVPPNMVGKPDAPTVGLIGALMVGKDLMIRCIAIGLITTVVNAVRYRRVSFKYVLAGLAFGLIFPIDGFLGYEYHEWKQGSLFKFGFLPDSDSGKVQANIELPPGASLDATEKVVERVEKAFMGNPDVKFTFSFVGTQGAGRFASGNSGSNFAQIQGTLYDKQSVADHFPWVKHTERLRNISNEIVSSLLTQAVGIVPGASVKISAQSNFSFGSAIQLSLTSDDRAALQKTALAIKDGFASGDIKGVINPDVTSKPGKPELRANPDRVALADLGLDVQTVGLAVRTLYEGNDDTKLRVNGREYPVRVMMDLRSRNNPQTLADVPIKFVQGNPVRLGSVASITEGPSVDKITRRARAEEIQVTADLLPGYAVGTVQAQIDAWLISKKFVPANVTYKALGSADAQSREQGFILGAIGLGLVLVYLLLASLYDNWLYPFIIQLSQPQAITGALLALILTDKSLSVVGIIGFIALIGLVGKNAILVVDYANTLRHRGRSRHDALVEAGPTRLRPILMTTLALILGTLPVALAIGRGSEFRETIGIIIIGGISLSTFLTLLVIPCSYTIFDDLSIGLSRLMGRKVPGPEDPLPPVGGSGEVFEREEASALA